MTTAANGRAALTAGNSLFRARRALGMGLLLVAAACGPLPPAAGPMSCPLRTPAEWQAFLQRYAADPRWSMTCEEGDCDDALGREIDSELALCADTIAKSPAIAACTANLRSFIPGWLRQHNGGSYGFSSDNQIYFAAQEGPDLPTGMMTPPAEIVAAIPDLKKVEQAASRRGIRWLVQASCLTGGRIFMLVPDAGGAFDAWILLNLKGKPKELSIDAEKTMSFLAAL